MTPAEHAATVEEGIETGEGNAWAWEGWPAVRESLAALVALAERATELEADKQEYMDIARGEREAAQRAEARATELERERDQLKAERNAAESMWSEEYTDTNLSPGMWALRLERERAERAETALRGIRLRHQFLSDTHSRDTCIDVDAALGETAPRKIRRELGGSSTDPEGWVAESGETA